MSVVLAVISVRHYEPPARHVKPTVFRHHLAGHGGPADNHPQPRTHDAMPTLADWYHVRFDETTVHRDVAPTGGPPWTDGFEWADVIRSCFMAGDWLTSDELYIFTSRREESYLIPTDADGGSALVGELIRRGLFPAELMLEALKTEGRLVCWPSETAGPNRTP